MAKVVNIEDYRQGQTSEVIWERIKGINGIMDYVVHDPKSTVMDIEMVLRLTELKWYLIRKAQEARGDYVFRRN